MDYRLKQAGDGGSTDPLTTAIIDSIIQTDAVNFHSKYKPYKKTADVAAANSYLVTINNTNFPNWLDGFSDITFIEYPADEEQDPRDAEISSDDWSYYEKSSTKYVRFLSDTPSSGTIRFTYTVKYYIDSSTAASTLFYDNDFSAFCDLAAALCCRSIAAKFGYFTDSTIGADAVEYRNKSDLWASRSKNFWDQYMSFMFPNVPPAFATKEFDTMFSALSEDRLTHPASSR